MSQIHPIHKLYTQKILNEFNIFLYLLFELNRIFAYKYMCDKKIEPGNKICNTQIE